MYLEIKMVEIIVFKKLISEKRSSKLKKKRYIDFNTRPTESFLALLKNLPRCQLAHFMLGPHPKYVSK